MKRGVGSRGDPGMRKQIGEGRGRRETTEFSDLPPHASLVVGEKNCPVALESPKYERS
jgi:hypothetical protein